MRFCVECGHYIPGGVEENCKIRFNGRKTAVCAIKDATDCDNFIDKEEMSLEGYSKIDLRRKKKRRNGRKSDV